MELNPWTLLCIMTIMNEPLLRHIGFIIRMFCASIHIHTFIQCYIPTTLQGLLLSRLSRETFAVVSELSGRFSGQGRAQSRNVTVPVPYLPHCVVL